jgi:hypothetical protein
MKRIFSLIMMLLPLLSFAQGGARVDIYYFHVTARTPVCQSIETEVKKTMDTYFSAQKSNGSLTLHVLNCEAPENKATAEKFLAYGTTLILLKTVQGKESNEDITGWAFQRIKTPDLFRTELKAKIEKALQP